MTPEQIKERASKIKALEIQQEILASPKCYLIISDEKVYFRTERSEPVYVEENLKLVWLLLESTLKVATVNRINKKIEDLCKE